MLSWKVDKCVLYGFIMWIVVLSFSSCVIARLIIELDLYGAFVFTKENMQVIWDKQITVTGLIMSIFLFFLEKANDRRLGMSYKYIFYHEKIFGHINICTLMLAIIIILICNFVIAYILSGIQCLKIIHVFMRAFFILMLISNILCLVRILEFFLVARYKESLIFVQIRKNVYKKTYKETGSKENKTIDIADKINRNRKLDCELVKKNEGYDSYFGDAILTLFALYFANPNEYEGLLECIAARIIQRNTCGFSEKWNLNDKNDIVKKLIESCKEKIDEDKMVSSRIKNDSDKYYDKLNDYLKQMIIDRDLNR